MLLVVCCFFFQAEDGIRDLVRSRGLGDVYKRQGVDVGDAESIDRHAPGETRVGEVGGDLLQRAAVLLSLIHI